MDKNILEFNVVSVDETNLQALVVFQIEQVSKIVQLTSVGQFVKSCPFELNFPTSIGKSKWVVILFANGQYEAGKPNETISVYLKMLDCEHHSAEFKCDVKFQLGSDYASVSKKDLTLRFDNVKTRWAAVKLINTNEMIVNGSRFIQDDMIFLSVHLNEHFTKHVSSMETSYSNNYMMETEPHLTPEHRKSYLNYSPEVNDNYWFNQPQNYDNAHGSTNASSLGNYAIFDSNLNNIENMVEYSDDENSPAKPTKSTSIRSTLTSAATSFKNLFNF